MEADRRRVAAALPRYEVGNELGRGAAGVVYAGRHHQLDRPVAIKHLPAAFGADPTARLRFAAEAQVVARLDHPHIVKVHDFVEQDGLCLIVMERCHGRSLWDRFVEPGLTAQQAVATVIAVAEALDYAHAHGVVHRDVKPSNIMFDGIDAPKLVDFGIAKLLNAKRDPLTLEGTALGTPAYMSPEQAAAQSLQPASDVYACGVVLYELLAGVLPFAESADPVVELYHRIHGQPRPIGDVTATPPSLGVEVMRALETLPADRHASAMEFAAALGAAGTTAWGPGWVGDSGITVMISPAVAATTERTTGGSHRTTLTMVAPVASDDTAPTTAPPPLARRPPATNPSPITRSRRRILPPLRPPSN